MDDVKARQAQAGITGRTGATAGHLEPCAGRLLNCGPDLAETEPCHDARMCFHQLCARWRDTHPTVHSPSHMAAPSSTAFTPYKHTPRSTVSNLLSPSHMRGMAAPSSTMLECCCLYSWRL